MRIHIGTDHAGLDFGKDLQAHLAKAGHEVVDHGPKTFDPEDDYPSFCINTARAVVRDQAAGIECLGIVFGGSGNGEQMAANKVLGARAALVWSVPTAELARQHNDANLISIGARQHTVDEAILYIDTFIATPFSFAERHERRIAQLAEYEKTGLIAGREIDWSMPEGHSVHRIARQFGLHFVGKRVAVTSPQGRFAAGASQLDGHLMIDAKAVGKQMFLEFDNHLWLRVHLGLYGAWDFAGDFTADAAKPVDSRGQDSFSSMGAPRITRLRMSEQETAAPGSDVFPPDPIGAVRVRLLTEDTVADLRGPTACEVLTPDLVQAAIARLGPDPLIDSPKVGERRFVSAVRKSSVPIGLLLMDQSVVSGIGNVYRAELLFRARIDPHKPGKSLTEEQASALWKDWTKLLKIGVKTGQMLTMDGLSRKKYEAALANREDRHWVYHRTGEPCRVCGSPVVMELAAGRKLYFCPTDQV